MNTQKSTMSLSNNGKHVIIKIAFEDKSDTMVFLDHESALKLLMSMAKHVASLQADPLPLPEIKKSEPGVGGGKTTSFEDFMADINATISLVTKT